MPSVANFPSAVRLAAGHAVGLLLLAADGDGLLELAAVGAGRGGAFAGRRHAAAVAGVGVAPGDRLADRRGGCALVHAFVPGWCITTGSDTIQRLNRIMVEQRRAKGRAVMQMQTVDWVI